MDPISATLAASSLASLGMGLFGGRKKNVPDISGELDRIRSLMAQARESAIASINKQAGIGRADAASNLAARGIYSSPVSQNTFNRLEDSRLSAISDISGKYAAQEADISSDLLKSLLGYKIQDNMLGSQISAARTGAGTSLLLQLLLRSMGQGKTPGTIPGADIGSDFMRSLNAPVYSDTSGSIPYYLAR